MGALTEILFGSGESREAAPEARELPTTEIRTPTSPSVQQKYVSPGQAQIPEWNAEQAIKIAYGQQIMVYRCAQVIAEDLASSPFRVGKSLPEKPWGKATYDERAPLAKLLGPAPFGPNPETSSHEFWVWSIINFIVTGRVGWELDLAPKTEEILGLWPMSPTILRPIYATSGPAYFSGYEYGNGSQMVKFPAKKVFYHWRPSQDDWREPESALQAARYDISVANQLDRYDYNFLKNNAVPSAVAVVQKFAESEQYNAFKRQFQSMYGGSENAGKMAFMEAEPEEGGNVGDLLDIKQLALSHKDAELVALYERKLRNIPIALGVPFSKLDASERTYENADVEDRHYWTSTVLPYAIRFRDAVNQKLAPRIGSTFGWFDLSDVEALKDRTKYQPISSVDAYKGGVITKDEARVAQDEEPLEDEDGASFYVAPTPPTTVINNNGGAPIPPPKELPPADEPPAPEEKPPTTKAKKAEKRDKELDRQIRRSQEWRSTDRKVRALETLWNDAFQRLFHKQMTATLSRYGGKRGRQSEKRDGPNPLDIFDPRFWGKATEEMSVDLFAQAALLGGQRIADQFPEFEFSITDAYVQNFIKQSANRLSGQVTQTTYDKIKHQMAEGVAAGESKPKIAKRIQSVFESASDYRANLIAQTEVLGAYNNSAVLSAQQLGTEVVAGKEWIATDDGHTDSECGDLDGMIVAIDDEFDGLDAPPAHANCRCTVAFVTPEDFTGRARPMIEVRAAKRMIDALGKVA